MFVVLRTRVRASPGAHVSRATLRHIAPHCAGRPGLAAEYPDGCDTLGPGKFGKFPDVGKRLEKRRGRVRRRCAESSRKAALRRLPTPRRGGGSGRGSGRGIGRFGGGSGGPKLLQIQRFPTGAGRGPSGDSARRRRRGCRAAADAVPAGCRSRGRAGRWRSGTGRGETARLWRDRERTASALPWRALRRIGRRAGCESGLLRKSRLLERPLKAPVSRKSRW